MFLFLPKKVKKMQEITFSAKQPKSTSEIKSSYITFTYSDLESNIQPFTLNEAVEFFFHNAATHPKYNLPPMRYMQTQCIICDEHNFESAHQDLTKHLLEAKHNVNKIVPRYIIELTISAEQAEELYKEKKFAELATKFMFKSEDKFNREAGKWQPRTAPTVIECNKIIEAIKSPTEKNQKRLSKR